MGIKKNFKVLLYFVMLKGVILDPFYIFLALVLESAIFPRSPVSNKNWRIVLETQIWVLGVLIAITMFLLLGPLNRQSKDIHVRILLPACMCTQLCLTLCDPMDYSPPGSSFYEILQARILHWVVIFCSRESS